MKVFLSHAATDQTLARKVSKVLQKSGLDVWDEQSEIFPGDNWAEKIGQALKEANAMVVLLTPAGVKSHSVHREIEYALGEKTYRQRLIPVFVGSPEKFQDEEIPWILRRLKSIRLTETEQPDEDLQQIADMLREVAEPAERE